MRSFLYFLPGATADDEVAVRAELDRLGLGYAFEASDRLVCAKANKGPDDCGEGVVVARENVPDFNPIEVGYFPGGDFVWRRIFNPDIEEASRPFVGLCTLDIRRPGPADLVRGDVLEGHDVRLGDGGLWHCPAAIGAIMGPPITPYERLPSSVVLTDEGGWQNGARRPEYDQLWALAMRVWDSFRATIGRVKEDDDDDSAVTMEFDTDDLFGGATLALQTNYRVGATEAALLNLFRNYQDGWGVLKALIDLPTIETLLEEQKKTTDSIVPGG